MNLKLLPLRLMQGRLTTPSHGSYQEFPASNWKEEFVQVKELGINGFEWVIDSKSYNSNPLTSRSGRESIKEFARRYAVSVESACADVFMEKTLLDDAGKIIEENVKILYEVIEFCVEMKMRYVVLPFVDNSRLRMPNHALNLAELLNDLIPKLEKLPLEIHLETDLNPEGFSYLLESIRSDFIKVNYDIGNSASLGYNPREELNCYGGRIGSVHIKDRVRGGNTVPIGDGNADLSFVLRELRELGYAGDYVLQIARGKDGDEQRWIRGQILKLTNILQSSNEQKLETE